MRYTKIKQKQKSETKDYDLISRIIYIGYVDEKSAGEVIEMIYDLNYLDSGIESSKREPITLIVNSPGGEVYDGIAIVDTMNLSKTPINVVVLGRAMSMGLLIAACGHYRSASKNSRFMYHEGSYEAAGVGKTHRNELNEYLKLEKVYDQILINKTNIKPKDLKNAKNSSKDWYFDANTALELGIIDEILE